MNDLVGGHVKLMFDNLASALPQHEAGKIRILAVCTPQRSQFIPGLPTMIEAGVPDFISVAWFAMAAPPGTSDAIIAKIQKDVVSVLQLEDVKKKYVALGAETIGNTSAEMAAFVAQQRTLWADVIKTANIPQVE